MFKKVLDFRYVRSGKEALGFYLAHLLLVVALGALIGVLLADSPHLITSVGTKAIALYCLVISILILRSRKMLNNFGFILLAILAAALGAVGGGLLGLIVPAILTHVGSVKSVRKTQ